MAQTLRSLNRCKDCRYTWYPRGKNLSRVCPNCGSPNVAIVVNWIPLVAVGAIALYLVFGSKTSDRTRSESAQIESPAPGLASVEITEAPSTSEPPAPAALVVEAPSPRSADLKAPATVDDTKATSTQLVESLEEKRSALAKTEDAPKSSQLPVSTHFDEYERIYSDEEISALEERHRYQGDDPIVRARLGIPSRETKKLIR